MSKLRLVLFAGGVAMLTVASSAVAATITRDAVQDTFIMSGGSIADTNYNGQLVRVTRATDAGSLPRGHGILAFNLSGISDEITAAHLEYYQVGTTSAGAHGHEGYRSDPADGVGIMNETTMTYNLYVSTYASSESPAPPNAGFSAISALSLPADSADGVYHVGPAANAADLAYLNSRASKSNAADQFAQFLFWQLGNNGGTGASQSRRVFGDHESGNPVRLVLTTVPEPGSAVLAGMIAVGLFVARRMRSLPTSRSQ